MNPYSNDLRLRIIEAIQENEETQPEIAGRFSVSTSFVEKLWHRFRATGDYKALLHSGGRERILQDEEQLIRAEVASQPDATLAELCQTVAAASGKPAVTTMTMCNELRRLALPRKKR